MSAFTKKMISDTFLKLCRKNSVDSISVTRLVNECGINRKTFYYYYTGIDALLSELILTAVRQASAGRFSPDNWQDGYQATLEEAQHHRKLVLDIYHSKYYLSVKDSLMNYFYEIVGENVRQSYERVSENATEEVPDRILEPTRRFYATLLVSLTEQYLVDGMKESPENYTKYIYTFMHESMYPVFRRLLNLS